jgi:hypothetical protein
MSEIPLDAGDAPRLTVTKYQNMADEASRVLDAFVANLPHYQLPDEVAVQAVYGYLSIPDEFLGGAIAAVDQSPALQGIEKLSVSRARDALQFRDAFLPIARKVLKIGNALEFTVDFLLAKQKADALQIYAVAKALARDAKNPAADTHVANMRRYLRRGRHAKRKSVPAAGEDTPPEAKE